MYKQVARLFVGIAFIMLPAVGLIAQSAFHQAPSNAPNVVPIHPVAPCKTSSDAAGTIRTVVGTGYAGLSGIPGPATRANLILPGYGAFDGTGNFYFPEIDGEGILKLDACSGLLSVVAGSGVGGYSGDGGPATLARFNHPYNVAFGPSGALYVSDSRNNVIRKIHPRSGIITTIVGTGQNAGPGNTDPCAPLTSSGGKASTTAICNPSSVVIDGNENIYFINSFSQLVEASAATGSLTVLAGTGAYGYTGDNGPAVNATFSWIQQTAYDGNGNFYITDTGNCAIRKVNVASGIITSIVGHPATTYSGTCGLSGDGGPASAAKIGTPFGVALDKIGNLYIGDEQNNIVRVIAQSNGNMYTIAGKYSGTSAHSGYSGDGGPANQALLTTPEALSVDSSGNLYLSDTNNYVVRKITDAASLIP